MRQDRDRACLCFVISSLGQDGVSRQDYIKDLNELNSKRTLMMMMMFNTISARDSKARRGDGKYVRLDEEAG